MPCGFCDEQPCRDGDSIPSGDFFSEVREKIEMEKLRAVVERTIFGELPL